MSQSPYFDFRDRAHVPLREELSACVRWIEPPLDGALCIETNPGPEDETESEWLARLDAEAAAITAALPGWERDLSRQGNSRDGAQYLTYVRTVRS